MTNIANWAQHFGFDFDIHQLYKLHDLLLGEALYLSSKKIPKDIFVKTANEVKEKTTNKSNQT